jgi:AcrR family transcriptional regulator
VSATVEPRGLRADAQLNQDRILQAAAIEFAHRGDDVSMKDIAKSAGVGIGTLYRRFPTRERLIEATYRSEVARICTAAPELLASMEPAAALQSWMAQFLDFLATKHGMADALRAVLTDDEDRLHTRQLLTEALALLITAGVESGTIRDVDPTDVLLSVGGISLIAGQSAGSGQAIRLMDLLLGGILVAAVPPVAPTGTSRSPQERR